MSSYRELVKNFERIRAYMREFYVYGFKSREEYDRKSARSYDDERRRMESWLGEYMRFVRTFDGKNVFLSIDSRVSEHNPLYRAWKAKSFTDGDITLHFILFDILYSADVALSLSEIMERIDRDYLSNFSEPLMLDESTVRKKLKEYEGEGIVTSEKQGRRMLYRRVADPPFPPMRDVLDFFSEVAPCGVVGSFLLDREKTAPSAFNFKHHYITDTLDSEVLATLFTAMRKKCAVTLQNHSRHAKNGTELTLVPLRIFISVQSGRQHLLAAEARNGAIRSFRLDYLSEVRIGQPCERFDELRARLNELQPHFWGVTYKGRVPRPEHVEFIVRVEPGEEYIVNRLEREKRGGRVEKIDECHYRFVADVYDTGEMLPWIRTFICRITQMNFDDRTVENRLKHDLEMMYRAYGIEGGDEE